MIDYSRWSLQSLFNKVSQHLLKQNKSARNNDGYCVCYDAASQRRCAYGCLVPLSYYKKNGDTSITNVRKLTNIDYCDENDLFLGEIQRCHDNVKPSKWSGHLRKIARKYKLEIPEFLRNK